MNTSNIYKVKNVAIFVYISAILSSIIYFYIQVIRAGGNSWITGEWLINYNSGFVRRGAFGQVAFYISEITNIDLLWVVAMLQIIALIACYYLVLLMYFKVKRSNLELMILLSPAFLLFPFYDFSGGFRKEILVFIPFLVYCLYLYNKRITIYGFIAVLTSYSFAILSHELSVFVLPFFIAVTYLFYHLGIVDRTRTILIASGFVFLGMAGLLIPLLFSGVGKSGYICEQLLLMGLNPSICDGAIAWLEFDAVFGIRLVWVAIFNNSYISTYFLALCLSLLPFSFLKCNIFPKHYYHIFMLFSFLFTVPLYIVAFDWGRWIYIYIFFISNIVFVLVHLDYIKIDIKMPLFIVAIYATIWSIPHASGGGLGTGMERYILWFMKKVYIILGRFELFS